MSNSHLQRTFSSVYLWLLPIPTGLLDLMLLFVVISVLLPHLPAFVELRCARGRNGLCFDSKVNLWQYSTFQSGAGEWKEKREKEKAEVVRRKWATWIRAGYKKQLCVGWMWLCSRLIRYQVPLQVAGGVCVADGASQLSPCWVFQVLLSLSDGLDLNPELYLWHECIPSAWEAGTPHCTHTSLLQVSSHDDLVCFCSITSFLK